MTIPPDQLGAIKREVHKETKELINIGCVNFLIDHLASTGRLLPDGYVAVPQAVMIDYEARLDMIKYLLPLAKGYVHANAGIRSTECIIEDAEAMLAAARGNDDHNS